MNQVQPETMFKVFIIRSLIVVHFLAYHRLICLTIRNYSPKLSLSRNCIINTLVGNWGYDPIRFCLLNWARVPRFRINIVPFNSMVNSYDDSIISDRIV